MNQEIVNNINKYVKEDDILIHLGDWSFGGIQNIWEFRKQINCKNIYLCYGNHDEHIIANKILPNCIWDSKKVIDGDIKKDYYQDYSFGELTDNTVKAQDLFTVSNYVLDILVRRIVGVKNVMLLEFFCSHFSHRIWDKRHKGRNHLFGHSHGSLDNSTFDKSMDVGIDSAFKLYGEYRPFNIREVIQILSGRNNNPIDHHIKTTN